MPWWCLREILCGVYRTSWSRGKVEKLQDRQNSKIIHSRYEDMASARERMLGMAACVNVAYQNQLSLIDVLKLTNFSPIRFGLHCSPAIHYTIIRIFHLQISTLPSLKVNKTLISVHLDLSRDKFKTWKISKKYESMLWCILY